MIDTVSADTVEPTADASFTIDGLAAAAGLPSRTVRHYQSEGALPPPRRQGRLAFYGPAHLERLRLIGRLQDRGLRLDAIRDALREVERGHLSLEAWLGLSEQMRAPWSDDTPVLFAEADLQQRVGDSQPGVLAALLEVGLITRAEGAPGAYLVPSPRLLDIALALRAAGIDLETCAGALELLRTQARRTADDLVGFLLRRTAAGFAGAGTPEDVATALAALRARVPSAVDVLVAQEMERSLRAAFEQGRPRLVRAPAAKATTP